MALSFWPAASRYLRDSATASNVLVFVSINEFQWVHDTDGRLALQQIDCIEARRALHVDEVAEVPTHEVIVPRHRAGGDMPRVVGVFGCDDALRKVRGGELIHFVGDIEDVSGANER